MAATASSSTHTADLLLEDIKLHMGTEIFRRHLEKCSRQKVEAWKDTDHLDLLHHAILENNFVVVGTLFAHGYFKPPHEVSTSWSYIHLAGVLGHRTIVSMLLQERPYDNKKQLLDWDLFERVISPKAVVVEKDGARIPLEERDKQLAILPVDLAARFGHILVVKTILDFHIYSLRGGPTNFQRSSKDSYLDMACKLDSPMALRLLLSEASSNKEDAKTALDISLKMAKPECIDALLRYGIDTKHLFGGMNLFHVLFAYSKTFEEAWCESFVTVTSVLLRHGLDVNACRPSRTYPLYSLLRCMRVTNMEKSAPYILAALLLVLQGGANPNFDEVFVEQAVMDKEYNTAFGRQPYPSALHCLIDAAQHYREEVADGNNVTKHTYKCCELLLRHGADPSYVGKYRDPNLVMKCGNVLHALADVGTHIGRVDRALLLLLLRHGADPDQCAEGRYPLTAYCDFVCGVTLSTGTENPPNPAQQNRTQAEQAHSSGSSSPRQLSTVLANEDSENFMIDVRRMCRMIGFMSRTAQNACEKAVRSKLMNTPSSSNASSSSSSSSLSQLALQVISKELEEYTRTVDSLKRCCSMVVWRSCRRHVGNVYKLPAPMPLINVLLNQL